MSVPAQEPKDGVYSSKPIGFVKLAKGFSLPLILLASYVVARLLNYQPELEIEGLSDFFRDFYLAFGCSVCYFMFLIQQTFTMNDDEIRGTKFWIASCLLLILVLFDDVFMLHEQFGSFFDISDKVLILINGGLLGLLLLVYRKRLCFPFWLLIGVFGLLSAAAIVLDNTATYWNVGGRQIDLEQIFELLGLLALSSAFCIQALRDLQQVMYRAARHS